MTDGPELAVLCGLLLVGGVLGLITGLRKRPWRPPTRSPESPAQAWARLTHRPVGAAGRRRDMLLITSVVVGLILASLSGLVIAIVALPALALVVPAILTTPKARDVQQLEALDRWVRTLSAALPTGKSIPDAIRLSRRTAPEELEAELGVLVARLNNRWETRDALMRFADALDNPDADGVVAALILASNRGSNGAAITLTALADSLQAQLKGRREVETERAKPYTVVRQVTLVTAVTMALALVFGRGFFAPYGTPVGQLLLAALIAAYLGSLLVMRRRARPRPRERILIGVHR